MATLSVSEAVPRVGQPVSILGEGFTGAAVVTISLPSMGIQSEITADGAGDIGTNDVADHAVVTLTSTGNAVAAETVTLGAVTYTWRASVTTTANEILVGASASASLDNLKSAVNLTAGSGTTYGSLTVIHPTIEALAKTATTLKFGAKTGGTAGNSLASTDTMTNMNFGAATLLGGTAATGLSPVIWTPTQAGTYVIEATDGTESANATVRVWVSA